MRFFILNVCLKDSYALCKNRKANVLSCRDVKNNLKLQWIFDITQFGKFKNIARVKRERQIYSTHLYKDKIIVSISRAVLALDFKTGELIWKIDINDCNPTTLLINENKCYIAKGVFYTVIDLDKGTKTFKTSKKQIQYKGKQILLFEESPIAYHDNKVWYLFTDVINEPQHYLASFTPENLELQTIQALNINNQHRQPVFDGNRLYVLEDCGILKVFENQ